MSRRHVFAWLPAAAYMALIWLVSSLQLPSLAVDDFPLRDKGVHFVEYGILGFLLAHAAVRTWPRRHVLRTAGLAVLITLLWGLLDEIHQAFMNQPRSLTNHRGNILNPIWTHAGIGIAYNPDGSLVVSQNFISAPGRRLRGQ